MCEAEISSINYVQNIIIRQSGGEKERLGYVRMEFFSLIASGPNIQASI